MIKKAPCPGNAAGCHWLLRETPMSQLRWRRLSLSYRHRSNWLQFIQVPLCRSEMPSHLGHRGQDGRSPSAVRPITMTRLGLRFQITALILRTCLFYPTGFIQQTSDFVSFRGLRQSTAELLTALGGPSVRTSRTCSWPRMPRMTVALSSLKFLLWPVKSGVFIWVLQAVMNHHITTAAQLVSVAV